MFFHETQHQFTIEEVFITQRSQMTVAESGRTGFCIGYRLNGGSCFMCGDQALEVQKGDLLFVPPELPYLYKTESEEIIIVHLMIEHPKNWQISRVHLEDPETAARKFTQLLHVWNSGKPGYKHRAAAILYDIFADIDQQLSTQRSTCTEAEKKLTRAIEYLHRNYYRSDLDIGAISAASNISETYFRKLFHQYYSTSPLQYIRQLRIKKAAELLRADDMPVNVIAATVGFTDPLYFSRVFRTVTGQTPSEFRKHQRE